MEIMGAVRNVVAWSCVVFGVVAGAEAYSPRSSGMVRTSTELPFFAHPPGELKEQAIQWMLPGGSDVMRQQGLEALVGSSMQPLDWPALPRVWWKYDSYDTSSRDTYVGFQWSQSKITGSTKHTFTLKYSRNVGLVLIGSLRSKDGKGGDLDADGALAAPELVVEDPDSGYLYPNVREGYPMVGMCVFELSMASEESSSFSLDFLGSGHKQEKGKGFGTPFTLFSNFFQLDTEKPIIGHYLKEHCQKKFEQAVRPWAEKQFQMAHRAYRTETMSTCKRERHGKDRLAEGDRDCLAWHRDTFPSEIQRATTARCERGENDLFTCVLRQRDIGGACPMAQNREARFEPSKKLSSYQLRSFPCDEGANLTCVSAWPAANIEAFEKQRIFLGIDKLTAMGVCRPK
ncbi:MAG: hypothetical protein KF767_07365 [Bdellovibrionaceae bacterium]|nr:hypothetical protein [Pseudobdellovibrionaceae bacterium]